MRRELRSKFVTVEGIEPLQRNIGGIQSILSDYELGLAGSRTGALGAVGSEMQRRPGF